MRLFRLKAVGRGSWSPDKADGPAGLPSLTDFERNGTLSRQRRERLPLLTLSPRYTHRRCSGCVAPGNARGGVHAPPFLTEWGPSRGKPFSVRTV